MDLNFGLTLAETRCICVIFTFFDNTCL